MGKNRKGKRKDPDSDGSSSPAKGQLSQSQCKRPVCPYLNYYVQKCRNKLPECKMTVEMKRKIRAEFESLSEEAKKPFIDETERQREVYKQMKTRLIEQGHKKMGEEAGEGLEVGDVLAVDPRRSLCCEWGRSEKARGKILIPTAAAAQRNAKLLKATTNVRCARI